MASLVDQYDELFEGFDGREEKLKGITRFSLYDVMFYRTSLFSHSKRVPWLLEAILPYAKDVFPNLDETRALVLAMVHDDAEILTGDIQAGNKSKMTEDQLREVYANEKRAIDQLAETFPTRLGSFVYRDLLHEVLESKTVEVQLVRLADKMEAFGESLHEVFAGNTRFVTRVVNEYGTIPTPLEYYPIYLAKREEKFPLLKDLFSLSEDLLKVPERIDFSPVAKTGQPHDEQSFKKDTMYPYYNHWKSNLRDRADQRETRLLLKQVEFI